MRPSTQITLIRIINWQLFLHSINIPEQTHCNYVLWVWSEKLISNSNWTLVGWRGGGGLVWRGCVGFSWPKFIQIILYCIYVMPYFTPDDYACYESIFMVFIPLITIIVLWCALTRHASNDGSEQMLVINLTFWKLLLIGHWLAITDSL